MIEEKASLSGFDDPCSRHPMSFWGMKVFGRRGRISVGKDQRLRIDCRFSRGNAAAAAGSACPVRGFGAWLLVPARLVKAKEMGGGVYMTSPEYQSAHPHPDSNS
jgi:hypothetical protein